MIRRPLLLTIAAWLALICRPAAAHERNIVLLADEWCPYNCDPQSDHPGTAVEIARAAFAPLATVEYRTMNWGRSVAEIRLGRADAVIGISLSEGSGLVFPHEPIGMSSIGLLVRLDSTFQYGGPSSLDGRVIGMVASYRFAGPCGDYLAAHMADPSRIQLVAGEGALQKNLLKLQAGRIDIVVDDANVLAHLVAGLGSNPGLRLTTVPDSAPVYIAFSPAVADARQLADGLDSAIIGLRASGRLKAILARYGVLDWK